MTRIEIAGASGLVGGALLQAALASPEVERVTALARRPLGVEHPKLSIEMVDFDHLDAAPSPGSDVLFCCLGTTIRTAGSREAFRRVDHDYPLALAARARAGGARLFSVVSAMGADPQSRVFYNRVKGEVERDLTALELPALHILRPGLLLGEREEFRVGEEFAKRAGKLLPWVGPLARYRPIEAAAVARFMLARALETSPGVRVFESPAMQGA